ncbi:retrovirus-related pol polyprotein from transposon TNT 1-94 [Tanacetum coccineum]
MVLCPSATITSGDQSIPNLAFTTWNDFDQRAIILLNSSLTEEAAAEVIVDKLAAIGQPVDEMDKLHWDRQHAKQNYSRGGGRASNSNGGRGQWGQASPSLPVMSHQWALCLLLSISSYLCLECCYTDANLAQAFTSQCHVTQGHPDWYVDSGDSTRKLCEDGLCDSRYSNGLAETVGVSRIASLNFVTSTVRKIFEDNGTLHRLSCPYTPQQNGRAERKHRHLVETGLAMLFMLNVPASYWLCTFLEDGPPISDAPVLESRPTDTRPSSSSPCGLCPVPTTAAEPIHEPDSTRHHRFI